MDRFKPPTCGDQFGGEPVQQLGVRRGLAAYTKVAGRRDQASTEVKLPQPIDNDSHGQRIGRVRQPLRQCRSTAGFVPVPFERR